MPACLVPGSAQHHTDNLSPSCAGVLLLCFLMVHNPWAQPIELAANVLAAQSALVDEAPTDHIQGTGRDKENSIKDRFGKTWYPPDRPLAVCTSSGRGLKVVCEGAPAGSRSDTECKDHCSTGGGTIHPFVDMTWNCGSAFHELPCKRFLLYFLASMITAVRRTMIDSSGNGLQGFSSPPAAGVPLDMVVESETLIVAPPSIELLGQAFVGHSADSFQEF